MLCIKSSSVCKEDRLTCLCLIHHVHWWMNRGDCVYMSQESCQYGTASCLVDLSSPSWLLQIARCVSIQQVPLGVSALICVYLRGRSYESDFRELKLIPFIIVLDFDYHCCLNLLWLSV